MKKYRILQLCVASSLFFAGCSEDEIINPNTGVVPMVGDEVVFGTRAGFEDSNPKTRTEYSGQTYTTGNKTFERINWIAGDMVQIYSPESPSSADADKTFDYVVNQTEDSETYKDYATLAKPSGTESTPSLQWGANEQTFYALYPSPQMFPTETDADGTTTVKKGIKMNEEVLTGTIPRSQPQLAITKNATKSSPYMNYAYMAAKTVTAPVAEVPLTFYPLVTAVEITLTMPSDAQISTTLTGVLLSSTQNLRGDFTYDLADWTVDENGQGGRDGYPACDKTFANEGTDVYIPLNSVISQAGVTSAATAPTLVKGESIKVMAFLLPGVDVNNLTVTVYSSTGNASKTLQRDDNSTIIATHLKTRIENLQLPKTEIDNSNWMSQLPDAMLMNKISLPGTGNSWSAAYTGATPDYYASQSKSFIEQWNLGIRAFEITTNHTASSFADEPVKCNGASLGLTAKAAIDQIMKKIQENPDETAMLICAYRSEGSVSQNRKPATYMENVYTYLASRFPASTRNDSLVLFNPDLTLKDARGKLMIVVRPTQTDIDKSNTDDSYNEVITYMSSGAGAALNGHILVVHGCGNAPEKWGKRGYTINGSAARDLGNVTGQGLVVVGSSTSRFDASSVEFYMADGHDYLLGSDVPAGDWSNVQSSETGNFVYPTSSDNSIWFQEWARVVPSGNNITGYFKLNSYTTNVTWRPSYEEKLNHAKATLDMALSDDGTYVYINSLCGFYMIAGNSSSTSPISIDLNSESSVMGDIKGLATDLNDDFYDYVLSQGITEKTGPTGIVMMDYVGETEKSAQLPTLIITNNFKFDN